MVCLKFFNSTGGKCFREKGDVNMIAEERVVTYIRSLETEECPVLEEIERDRKSVV